MLFDFTLKITFSLTGTIEDAEGLTKTQVVSDKVAEADFGQCEDIETLDINIDGNDFSASLEARYHVAVEANTLAEAKERATTAFSEEDFGEAEDIDMEFVNFTDSNEDIVEAEDFEQWAIDHNAN